MKRAEAVQRPEIVEQRRRVQAAYAEARRLECEPQGPVPRQIDLDRRNEAIRAAWREHRRLELAYEAAVGRLVAS